MEHVRDYSTIGIEGFVCGPKDPLPHAYLRPSSSDDSCTPKSPSYESWEITGNIKEDPEDFVVREILPKENGKFSKVFSHYETVSKEGDGAGSNSEPLNVATMPSIPPMRLPFVPENSSTLSKDDNVEGNSTDVPPKKKTIVVGEIPTSKEATAVLGDAPVKSEKSLEESFRVYIQNVATKDIPTSVLLKSIEALNEKAINRFPTDQSDNKILLENTQVWIPPLHLQKDRDVHNVENITGGPTSDTDMKARRKGFHRAIRILYPFLKTESSPKSTASTTESPNEAGEKPNVEHWIKISIDDSFDELVKYLHTPRDDLEELFLFRNWGFEGPPKESSFNSAKSEQSAVLKLRQGVSKDDRRKVHHIIAQRNKHFETSIRNQTSKPKDEIEEKDKATTDLVVTWKKQALRKGFKNKKRKRSENGRDNQRDNHLLCVLKKAQKEHLTAMQILSRSLRCRQGDIGFAGIKDMQAITYQFVTLRNMGQHRAERAIRQQLQNRDVELKILCSNVDFVLNIGDLEGNQFDITVRNLKRVKVDWKLNSNINGKPPKEFFVDCDKAHIIHMVERVQKHGFINFYGEQRVGAPGRRQEVGVRAFEIGRAMIRKEFKIAIDLLMEGTRHNETEEVRRIRQAWKDSYGNSTMTLKAFGKADIMPRERAILRGLNRYPDNPLEAIRFLSYNMRIFYINAYQSFIFNRTASERIKLHGDKVVRGDLYFDKEGDHRDNVKVVHGNETPPIEISQVVLPLPGYNVQYPDNEIGKYFEQLLAKDRVTFEKNAVPEATASGSYRKLIVHPTNLTVETSESSCDSMKLSFQLPKGSYATMLLRELMVTTVAR